MTYIKNLVMHGFKSFARKTDLPFNPEINVIIGPNGSGKSNVADALCFVLGRLSAKSMRAERSSNLIFNGTKVAGPAKEAVVEIIFDNADKTFYLEENEVSIKRILRKNGQSIYRINGKTQTRQDVLALLAQAGIDPNGFNIILQNEIQNFAVGSSEERRKVIEEVAGISIYEIRKEKSLNELDKTSEKLKEVEAILKERTGYLNNLEKEKEAAQKKKDLESDLKKFKASIIYFDLTKKKKEKEEIEKQINEKNKEIESYQKIASKYKSEIEILEEKITEINSEIQKQTGIEQEQLNKEISDLRAEIAVLKVKLEGYEKKIKDSERQKSNYEKIIQDNELAIRRLQDESPTIKLIQKELEKKKIELQELEEKRKKYYTTKTELRSINERLEDKKKILQNYENESNFLMKQIDNLIIELYDKKSNSEILEKLKFSLTEKKEILEKINLREREIEKTINTNDFEIKREKSIIEKIEKIDICPLCKNKITENHIHSINEEISPKINKLEEEIKNSEKELINIENKRNLLKQEIESMTSEIQKRNSDIIKLKNIDDKEQQIKILHEKITYSKNELKELEKKKVNLEEHFDEDSTIEEKYEHAKLEFQDISIRNKENLDSEIQYKQKELERATVSINQIMRDEEYIKEEIIIIKRKLEEKEDELKIKKTKEEEVRQKAEKLIKEKNEIHYKQRQIDQNLSIEKNRIYNFENEINNLKVEKARVDAQIQNFETDLLEYQNVEIMKSNKEHLIEKLKKVEDLLSRIGTVNMRALEVYEEVKKEYDTINEKVEIITKEKEKIIKIIAKIDIEKKKVFLKTIEELNTKFERNFSQISAKGQVYLEIQNKKDPFADGIDVILKTGHGKYFDIKSLSGGEKTLVALSLIFAIQELKPYSFYILDEIDAALDKRNASRLADFLKKYAQKGQYIIISHNDEIITNSETLFGVSMHDGISKLTSLRV